MEKLTRFGWQLNQSRRILGLNKLYCAWDDKTHGQRHRHTTFEWPKTVSARFFCCCCCQLWHGGDKQTAVLTLVP